MSISHRERLLVKLAVLVGGGLLLYLLVADWAIPKWQRLGEEITQVSNETNTLQGVGEAREQKEQQYERELQRAMRYDTPVEAERVFINKLNSLARAATMPTPNIKPRTPAREDRYDVIRINFDVRCNLAQAMRFLHLFYGDDAAQRIDTIKMIPVGRYRNTDDLLQVTMQISALVVPEGGKQPAGDKRRG